MTSGGPGPGFGHLWRSGFIVPSEQATIHVRSVGHASVSAVFEGVNGYWNGTQRQLFIFRLKDHLERLVRSAELSHLDVPHPVDDLVKATVDLLRRNAVREDVHIRPWMFAAGNPVEQMVAAHAACETVIDSWPYTTGLGDSPRTARAAVTSWTRISADSMPPGIKAFANYHNGRLGNIDARSRGADWPIFLNPDGEVTESSGATVALIVDGTFVTPSLDSGILEGVTRATALELLRADLGIDVEERTVTLADLERAQEIMFLGTSAEITPIVELDGRLVGDGSIGRVTQALRSEYRAVILGDRPSRHGWLTAVWPGEDERVDETK